jgi:hypothetical protein
MCQDRSVSEEVTNSSSGNILWKHDIIHIITLTLYKMTWCYINKIVRVIVQKIN